jgi:glycerol-3-phosphate O-acyltransferase
VQPIRRERSGGGLLILSILDWVLLGIAAALTVALTLWTVRRTRVAIQHWFNRAVLRAVHQFEVRLDRYKLVSKRTVRDDLLADREVLAAMEVHGREQGLSADDVRRRVEQYLREIVPQFNVLSYYKFGYNVARVLINLLYRVDASYRDRRALDAIPRGDVVVYLMNHRSNADYVVVAYVLARAVSISYAVGEWARVWPLEYVFKSFGAYFVRRGFRDPLYHTVLRRYVQLITRNGVTQGIFLEGGLSRDGLMRPAKIGLLDAVAGALRDFPPERDIQLVPVALNYDRVLEDRTLIAELVDDGSRPGRVRQLLGVVHYITWNVVRLVTGNLRRYGRVHVHFGTPVSLREWTAGHPGVLDRSRDDRLPEVQRLADGVRERIGELIPVTPVPLVAASILSLEGSVLLEADVLERIDGFRDELLRRGANLVQPERAPDVILDRAWRTLRMRRLVVREGDSYVVFPRQRPLLEYYANSIRHLLPALEQVPVMTPALETDPTLPRLGRWAPRGKGERGKGKSGG